MLDDEAPGDAEEVAGGDIFGDDDEVDDDYTSEKDIFDPEDAR